MGPILNSLTAGFALNCFLYWLVVSLHNFLSWPSPNIPLYAHAIATIVYAIYFYPTMKEINNV